ncbi:MAG TPA: SHOCT domain-containing protein [Trebonia sp.]|jgi:uncharacterized membrane protein|nr:SHOCT domain-containing protein [Trebonia sp.]
MATDTFDVLAASYETPAAAEADYQAVGDLYRASGLINVFDAVVITRDDAGKVSMVAKSEQPARPDAWRELGIGLAGGVLVALFPAISLGTGLRLGGTGGAGLRAMAGHVAAGLGRANVKDLGELLDVGRGGLVVVAAGDLGDSVERTVRRAGRVTRRQLTVDEAMVERDIGAAASDLAPEPDEYQREVARAEAAVREAESEAAAAEREAEQYSTFGPAPDASDLVSALEGLARLRESGMLSTAEFEAAKARLLAGG